MVPIRRVAVIGAGAVGAVYAAKLHQAMPEGVFFIAGGERGARLLKDGVVVNGRPVHIPTADPEKPAAPAELILVAVKHHQLPQAILDIRNYVGEDTLILSLMNGIDSEEQMGAVYGMEKVLYGTLVGIDAVREGHHRVRYTNEGKLLFGEARNPEPTPKILRVKETLDRAGILNEIPEDMLRTLWWKLMINAGTNQVSAILHAPYGVFQTVHEAQEVAESAMREVVAVAQAAGITLEEQDIQDWYTVLPLLSPQGKTSMLQDIEARRKTEVEMFGGRLVELGQEHGIPTPVNETVFKMIRVLEGYYLPPEQ